MTSDASNVSIAGIRSQGPLGSDKPKPYLSRTLNNLKQTYNTIEKELHAFGWTTKKFWPYLYGLKFKIIGDHMPLKWLISLKEPNNRLVRWYLTNNSQGRQRNDVGNESFIRNTSEPPQLEDVIEEHHHFNERNLENVQKTTSVTDETRRISTDSGKNISAEE